jgi:hypothetical protein
MGLRKLLGAFGRHLLQLGAELVSSLDDVADEIGPLLGWEVPGRAGQQKLLSVCGVEPIGVRKGSSEGCNG